MAKLQDVAKLAGVSTATVSRTLNSPALVDPGTRSKVDNAIKQSGYTRNETARSLAMRSSRTIGLLTDNFSSNYFAPILDETIRMLHEHGYYTIVEATGNRPSVKDADRQKRAWRSLINRQVESIIVLCSYMEDAEINEMLDEFPSSIIVGRRMENVRNRCITVDHYIGGRLAAKHLIEKGHRDIAMISGPAHKHDSRQRAQGFIDELAEHNIALPDSRIFAGDYTITGGKQAMQALFKSGQTVSAVFTQNDDTAFGVINECYNIGINVPKELSVIGFDDSVLAVNSLPPLTTVSQPLKMMSQSAASLALNISKGREHETPLPVPHTHFQPTLIERQSVIERQ